MTPPTLPGPGAHGATRTRLASCAAALLVVLGAALLITAPTLLLSSHAQAISATSQPTLREVAVHTPLETVVPSQGSHLDWRLKPTFGVGPASLATVSPGGAHEQRREVPRTFEGGHLAEEHQTRAPPG